MCVRTPKNGCNILGSPRLMHVFRKNSHQPDEFSLCICLPETCWTHPIPRQKMHSFALLLLSVLSVGHAFIVPANRLRTLSRATQTPLQALIDPDSITSSLTPLLANGNVADLPGSYSKVSYYTVLGLYVMSFPGLWSQIKRSTSAKIKRKTFVR